MRLFGVFFLASSAFILDFALGGECPTNLGSCTASDVKTTVQSITVLNNDTCTSSSDTIDLRVTLQFAANGGAKYDLGVFVSNNGQPVQNPTASSTCFGAAPQVNEGFVDLEGPPDTCGDLSSANPIQWTVDVTVGCNIVDGHLIVPSCRVWSQNSNASGEVCTSIAQAGTGSKCDCSPLSLAIDFTPCTPSSCNDNNACTFDSCSASHTCVHTPINVNDNNACTTDACNPTTGAVTHTPINVNDNDVCTQDTCHPITGISHKDICDGEAVQVTSLGDSPGGNCTASGCDLRGAIKAAPPGGRVVIGEELRGKVIRLLREISLTKDITIIGPAPFTPPPSFDLAGKVTTASLTQSLALASKTTTNAAAVNANTSMVTISGQNITRVFNIVAGVDVNLFNTRISEGLARDSGGGLKNLGRLVVESAVFDSNRVESSVAVALFGGAIYNAPNASLKMTNSTFSNNLVSGTSSNLVSGGAIHNEGFLELFNADLTNNRLSALASNMNVMARGAAIYSSGNFELRGVNINTNEAFARVTSAAHEAIARGGGAHLSGVGRILESVISGNIAQALATSNAKATAEGGGLYQADAAIVLQISNLNMSDNKVSAATDAALSVARGGGLYNFGKVSGANNLLSRNNVYALSRTGQALAEGGAVYLRSSGSAELANSTVRDNIVSAETNSSLAQAKGAAFAIYGNAELTSSTLHRNQLIARTGGANTAEAFGGAIFVELAAKAELFSSTLSENAVSSMAGSTGQALASGAGIANRGDFVMRQSTLYQNLIAVNGGTLRSKGGGVYNLGNLEAYSLTLSRNVAGQGANLYNEGHLTLFNSALAANINSINYTLAAGGTVNSAAFNFANDASAASIARVVADLMLGPLADNGGPTRTMLPLPNSPLVDAGDPDFDGSSQAFDQRGLGFPRVTGNEIDVGSVEFQCRSQADCNDNNPGTDDVCIDLGCFHEVIASACSDSNICTINDRLSANTCIGDPAPVKLNTCTGITVDATSAAGAVVSFSPTTKDGCYNTNITCTPASGSTFAVGSTNVTCVARGTGTAQDMCMFAVAVKGTGSDTSSGCNASGKSNILGSDALILLGLLAVIGLWRRKRAALIGVFALFCVDQSYALKVRDPAAIHALKSESEGEISISKATGSARFVKIHPESSSRVQAQTSLSEVGQTAFFLSKHSQAFGISSADELFLLKDEKDHLGQRHLNYEQTYQGIPVFGAQLKLHFNNDGNLSVVNGTLVPDISVGTAPNYSAAEAAQIGIAKVSRQKAVSALQNQSNRLLIYRSGLVKGVNGTNHLAWEVEVGNGRDIREFVYVDAHNGKIIDQITGIRDALNRRAYNAENDPNDEAGPNYPDNPVWIEGQTPFPAQDTDVYYLLRMSEDAHSFFFKTFGFDSFDGKGGIMDVVFNRGKRCPNASWNGSVISFCDGFAVDDVTGHEWGHAYTDFTHNLVYKWQPGALNEAYSDIWGETIDLVNNHEIDGNVNTSPIRTDQSCLAPTIVNNKQTFPSRRWLLSEESTAPELSGPLRDMWNPNCFNNPNRGGSDPLYFCDLQVIDDGGVHTNSGVPNHAYALLVDGGSFNGFTIRGVGLVKAAAIYWRAQTIYHTPLSDFADHAVALRQSCNDLQGSFPKNFDGTTSSLAISADDCTQVTNTILAVELEDQHTECLVPLLAKGPGGEPPRLCKRTVFLANFEDSANGFVATRDILKPNVPAGFDQKWARTNIDLPGNWPGHAFFVNDQNIGDCKTTDATSLMRLTSPTITLPSGRGPFVLTFDHYIASEAKYDGGNVWIATNGGPFARISRSAFTFNPYNVRLADAIGEDASTNPMADQDAFSGTDLGTNEGSFGQSQANLSTYAKAGDSIQLRFDFATDCASTGSIGWYVDNVAIYDTTQGTISSFCGVGGCERPGISTCNGEVLTESCTPGLAQAETCNTLDDDCDGLVDDCDDNNACTTTDQCGSLGSCEGVPVAPVIQGSCPQDIEINGATAATGAAATFLTPATQNNCYPVTCNHVSGSTFPIGSTTVTCRAANALSQEASCTFKVIVAPAAGLGAAATNGSGCSSNPSGASLSNLVFLSAFLSLLVIMRRRKKS